MAPFIMLIKVVFILMVLNQNILVLNIVHAYSKKWHFEANVTKCAVVVLGLTLYIYFFIICIA